MERALDFLRDHKEIALATCEGNLPKMRIFQIMKQECNLLYFATSQEKAIYRELVKNPNVEVLAYADNVSVRCSGMVNFNVEDDTKRWIYDNNPVLPRLYSSYNKLVYFRLPIAEMDYYDLSPTPPMFKHYDLMVGEVKKSSFTNPVIFHANHINRIQINLRKEPRFNLCIHATCDCLKYYKLLLSAKSFNKKKERADSLIVESAQIVTFVFCDETSIT